MIDLQFSPDGSRLAVSQTGKLELLDARSWRRIATPRCRRAGSLHLGFSPDGRVLYAPYAWVFDRHGPLTMLRFAARDGRRLGRAERFAPGVRTPDRARLRRRRPPVRHPRGRRAGACATRARCAPLRRAPGTAVFPDREPGRHRPRLARTPSRSRPTARRSPRAARTARCASSTCARARPRPASGRHDGAVTGALFAGGSDLLVTIGDDARALVWDVERRAVARRSPGTRGACSRPRWTSAGARCTPPASTAASSPGTWSATGDSGVRSPPAAASGPRGASSPPTAISADGRTLVTNQRGGVSLIDTATFARRSLPVPGGTPEVNAPVFAADGRIAVAGLDGFLALVDPRSGRVHARLRGHRDVVFTPVTARGGRRIVTTGLDATLRRVGRAQRARARPADPARRPARRHARRRARRPHRSPCRWSAGPSTSSTSAARRRLARLSDRRQLRRRRRVLRRRRACSSPAATTAASACSPRTAGARWARRSRPTRASSRRWTSARTGAASSPPRPTARCASGTARPGARSARPLPGPRNVTAVAYFSPDGAYVYAVFANGRGYRWDVRAGRRGRATPARSRAAG